MGRHRVTLVAIAGVLLLAWCAFWFGFGIGRTRGRVEAAPLEQPADQVLVELTYVKGGRRLPLVFPQRPEDLEYVEKWMALVRDGRGIAAQAPPAFGPAPIRKAS